MKKNEAYINVFEALEDDPGVARNLYLRTRLMMKLRQAIKEKDLTQKNAATLLGVTQPRISDLTRGKIERFTLDMLVNMLGRVGVRVDIVLKKAA